MKAEPDGSFQVGARDKERDYDGPVADVYIRDSWLFIVTDEYEGCAMLNVEALPYLRRALSKLAKSRGAP